MTVESRERGWRARVRDRRWRRAAREWSVADDEQLRRPTLVVAPHPDDDTLGCGGTIARKRRLGVDVAVAVLTDGAFANRDLIDRAELTALRGREEIASLDQLGVGPHRAWFLGFRDGALRQDEAAAAAQLVPILEEVRPAEVFVTAADDGHPDHEAAYRIAAASTRIGRFRRRRGRVPGVVVAALAMGAAPVDRPRWGAQARPPDEDRPYRRCDR